MTAHRKSVHQEDAALQAEAFEEGVCHAIDMLQEIGEPAAADKLFARLFQPRTETPAADKPVRSAPREPL